jgi:transcriptional regulator with XRE-family HTH domain
MTWNPRPRDPQQQRGFDLIGAMVRRRRLALGWTQRYLESQCVIDQTVISRLENGRQYGLKWSRFADLVHALGGLDVAPVERPWPSRATRLGAKPRSGGVARPVAPPRHGGAADPIARRPVGAARPVAPTRRRVAARPPVEPADPDAGDQAPRPVEVIDLTGGLDDWDDEL